MNPITLPPEFIEENPRFKHFAMAPVLDPEAPTAPNVNVVVAVESITFRLPLKQLPTAYAAVVSNTLVLTTSVEEPVVVVGEAGIGGAELTNDELMALPGAAAFMDALLRKLLENWQVSVTPPDPEPQPPTINA